MPPERNSDERRRRGQRGLGAFSLPLVALLLGCDPSTPAAPRDGGAIEDASVTDASFDGGGDAAAAAPDAGELPRTCVSPDGADPSGTASWEDALGTASVAIEDRAAACRRTYVLKSTATLRDGQPDNPRTVREREGLPTLRSGHDLFDALHALA